MFPPENASNLKVSAIWLAPVGSVVQKPGLAPRRLSGYQQQMLATDLD
jgi:hypothetical protein